MSYLGAIEAGGTKMICALGREDGSVLESVSIPTTEPARCMPQILEFFQGRGIDALGVGCFGLLDLDRNSQTYGCITTTPKLRWRNYPLMRCLQDALGVPVGIDTDVNAAALAEATWGCSRGLGCSIYITVGTGIGVGIIVDGKPHHGMIHPECGHIPVNRRSDDPMVRGVCPYHGSCLEGLACGPAIESRWGRSPAELADCEAVWALEAYYLGQALCSYIYTISPERIVLGGGVMNQQQLLPLIRAEVNRQLGGYIKGKGLNDLDSYIVSSSLGGRQGIMGCLRLAADALEEVQHGS